MNDAFNPVGLEPTEVEPAELQGIPDEGETQAVEAQEIVLDRDQMLKDLLDWCNNFVDKSAEWRRNSYENQWRVWQRNSDSTYDPEIAAKKEKWQSKAVWPITASHRENAQAQLFKTEVGPRPPLEVKARPGIVQMGAVDQSENIRDLILREREKSRYELERNKVVEDKTTYGSGFARLRFETIYEERKVRVPQLEALDPNDPMSVQRHLSGQAQTIGYQEQMQEVVIYRGVRFEHLNIWDVFPDPRALTIKGNPIAYRYETTYGELVKGAQEGYYLPDCADKLKDYKSDEETPIDKKLVETDRKISESSVKRTEYGKRLRCYELEARLPKKWVLINGETIDDPEKLVPAVVRFHKACIVSVGLSEAYDGEPQIYKDDYLPVSGQFYGRGIPEMLKDVQLVSTETVNQRIDSGSIGLMQKFAVLDKYVVDPKDFEEGRNVIRIKAPAGIDNVDVRQVLARLDMGSPDRSAFVEPQEWERVAQDRTSVNRVTMGTSGQVKDANQTLGGMEMMKSSAGDKFYYIGLLSEFGFQHEVNRAYWKLIYANYNPEDVAMAIGPQRAQTFELLTPEQIENGYQYYPMGVLSMENKAMRQARLAQIDAQFGMMPYFNRLAVLKAELSSADEDPERFVIGEAEAQQIIMKAQEMASGMMQQMAANQPTNAPGQPQAPNMGQEQA